jgi:uncharacterized protein (TIGR03792 family)
MVIEWLTFRIPAAQQAAWIAADAAIWTPALAAWPGFAGKEVWTGHDEPDHLSLIIRWHSHDAWKAVPRATLDATEAAFRARTGAAFPVLTCTALVVRDAPP